MAAQEEVVRAGIVGQILYDTRHFTGGKETCTLRETHASFQGTKQVRKLKNWTQSQIPLRKPVFSPTVRHLSKAQWEVLLDWRSKCLKDFIRRGWQDFIISHLQFSSPLISSQNTRNVPCTLPLHLMTDWCSSSLNKSKTANWKSNPNREAGNALGAPALSQMALCHPRAGIAQSAPSAWPHSRNHKPQSRPLCFWDQMLPVRMLLTLRKLGNRKLPCGAGKGRWGSLMRAPHFISAETIRSVKRSMTGSSIGFSKLILIPGLSFCYQYKIHIPIWMSYCFKKREILRN